MDTQNNTGLAYVALWNAGNSSTYYVGDELSYRDDRPPQETALLAGDTHLLLGRIVLRSLKYAVRLETIFECLQELQFIGVPTS